MPDPYPEAVAFLESNKAQLGVPDPDSYVEDIKQRLDDKTEDTRRAAVLIAVDASKSLINIGVAFFAALGAFALTYRQNHPSFQFSFTIVMLIAAAILTVASMWSGFSAIGRAYRRAQRPPDANPSWSTRPLAFLLGVQSIAGLLSLAAFAIGVLFWDAGSTSGSTDAQLSKIAAALEGLNKAAGQQNITLTTLPEHGATNNAIISVGKNIEDITVTLKNIADQIAPARSHPAVGQVGTVRTEADLSPNNWRDIQRKLAVRGYPVGDADGIPGRNTRGSVRLYQIQNHAVPTGILQPDQIAELLPFHP